MFMYFIVFCMLSISFMPCKTDWPIHVKYIVICCLCCIYATYCPYRTVHFDNKLYISCITYCYHSLFRWRFGCRLVPQTHAFAYVLRGHAAILLTNVWITNIAIVCLLICELLKMPLKKYGVQRTIWYLLFLSSFIAAIVLWLKLL